MAKFQEEHLSRASERLSEVLAKAERRCARYSDSSIQRDLDLAFVQHLAVALHQITRYRREKKLDLFKPEENPTIYLKDAVLELHELSSYVLGRLDEVDSPFMKKFFENEDRWIRMITISLVGLLINICADNIRHSLSRIQKNLEEATKSYSRTPNLRVVK